MDIGEEVAALAEPHREVESGHVEQEREDGVCPDRHRVHDPGAKDDGQHRHQPGDLALLRLAGVEQPLEPVRVGRQERIQVTAVGQGPPLLEKERRNEGEEAHRFRSPRRQPLRKAFRFMSIPAVAPQM